MLLFKYRTVVVVTDCCSCWPSIYFPPHLSRFFKPLHTAYIAMLLYSRAPCSWQDTGYTWPSLWCTGGKYSGPETGESFERRHVLYTMHRNTFGDGMWRAEAVSGTRHLQLNDLNIAPSAFWVINSRRMGWAGRVARMGDGWGVYRFWVGKTGKETSWKIQA